MHGEQFLSKRESEASAFANNPSQDCYNTRWHCLAADSEDASAASAQACQWEDSRLRAAKYLQVVECISVGAGNMMWILSGFIVSFNRLSIKL
jgi:hypothetical protein